MRVFISDKEAGLLAWLKKISRGSRSAILVEMIKYGRNFKRLFSSLESIEATAAGTDERISELVREVGLLASAVELLTAKLDHLRDELKDTHNWKSRDYPESLEHDEDGLPV